MRQLTALLSVFVLLTVLVTPPAFSAGGGNAKSKGADVVELKVKDKSSHAHKDELKIAKGKKNKEKKVKKWRKRNKLVRNDDHDVIIVVYDKNAKLDTASIVDTDSVATQTLEEISVRRISVRKDKTEKVLERLRNKDGVVAAEIEVLPTTFIDPLENSGQPASSHLWYFTPNDMGGLYDLSKGHSAVNIAIVDSGVQADHPDLAAKIVYTYNLDTESETQSIGCAHGTHCAGTAAAVTGNNLGTAGVGWNVKLISVDANVPGTTNIDGVGGLLYAIEGTDASIISMSYGGDYIDSPATKLTYSRLADLGIEAGKVMVAAAGNKSYNLSYNHLYLPCMADGIICVGAVTTDNYSRASFSNYGYEASLYMSGVDIFAPGVDIYSTFVAGLCSACGGDAGYHAYYNAYVQAHGFTAASSEYSRWQGTSMATPFIAGVASVMLSVNPMLGHEEIQEILQDTGSAGGANVTAPIVHAYNAVLEAYNRVRQESDIAYVADAAGNTYNVHTDGLARGVRISPFIHTGMFDSAPDGEPAPVFKSVKSWYFFDGFDEWSTNPNLGLSLTDDGLLLLTKGEDPMLVTATNAVVFQPGEVTHLRIKYRAYAGSTWQGVMYYATEGGHTYSGSYKAVLTNPTLTPGEWIEEEIDLRDLVSGGDDFIANTVNSLRFDLGNSNDGSKFDIRYIKFGRY